ncbi:MAG: hypothetical protein CMI31_14755 [Opitutae bacterium]|nr:hypothetical protein [Opitutae bacterium]MBG31237.1 hypothetical protein [Opitutae bacterium]|tara:strand:- start:86 stop:1066 length:981 start_codon:yes stop_codon:yes gene_type:complete
MNKKLLVFLAIVVLGFLAFFLRFGGVHGFVSSWQTFSNGSTWMPFSPYGNRVENAAKLVRKNATHLIFEDQSLFWKGQGAKVLPKLNEKGQLKKFVITDGGSGYGPLVTASVLGAGASQFDIGEVTVRNGQVTEVSINKTGKWYSSPRIFFEGEDLPYSGVAEIKYRNGQLMDSRQYLEGELHGKWFKWKYNGIPLFEKDYLRGLKHGTHMYWYGEPIDPKDYKTAGGDAGDGGTDKKTYVSLWVEVNELVKVEFKGKHPSQASNKWIIDQYKLKGGSFGPKLLEHYENNQRHGLFEAYDGRGNKIFKDEYDLGKRIKHKPYDPTN